MFDERTGSESTGLLGSPAPCSFTTSATTLSDQDRHVRLKIVVPLTAAAAALAAYWMLTLDASPGEHGDAPPPLRIGARLIDVRTVKMTRLAPPPIRDYLEVLVSYELASPVSRPPDSTVYGELRVGRRDPSFMHLAGAASDPAATAQPGRGELRLNLDGEQNSGVTQPVFLDILRSDHPLALHVCVWDGNQVLAESEWIDFAPLRQRLTSLLK